MIIEMNKPPQYEGWSQSDIDKLILFPWESVKYCNTEQLSPVRLKEGITLDDIEKMPLMRQILHLMNLLEKKGEIKLTAKGFLPLPVVKEVYSLGIPDPYYETPDYKGKMHQLRLEIDNHDVMMAHGALTELRLVKVRLGKMSLTKRGKEMLKDPVCLLESVLKIFCQGGFVDNFDGYNLYHNFNGITLHGELMFLLMAKYGDEYRPDIFYGEKFWKMNPHLIDFDENMSDMSNPSETAYKCVSLRLIDRMMRRLGLVDVELNKRIGFIDNNKVKRSELFDRIIQVDKP